MSINYDQIQELGIIFGMAIALVTAIAAGVKRIYCKGKNDSMLNERITLLEDIVEKNNERIEKLVKDKEDLMKEVYTIGKSIENIKGILEGNGTKD